MWTSLRFRIAALVLASLVTVMVSWLTVSTMSDSSARGSSLERYVMLAILSLLGILVLALSYLSLKQLVVPLRVLTETVQAIARGNYHAAEKPIGGVHEIEQLRMSLDHLAHQVLSGQDAMEFYIARITDAEEEERKRLAREIHDDTIQSIVVLGQRVDHLQDLLEPSASTATAVKDIRQQVTSLSDSLRRFASDLRPPYLEDLGLLVALRQLAQESGAHLQMTGKEYALGGDREIALYRIVQEALRNAVKHARAQRVEVKVAFLPDQMVVSIEDDGEGFDVPVDRTAFARTNHFGLMGIQERAHLLGGTWQIRSERGRGTEVKVTVPLTVKSSEFFR